MGLSWDSNVMGYGVINMDILIEITIGCWLVVSTILKSMKVKGKDDIPYMKWKNNPNVPNHQPDFSVSTKNTVNVWCNFLFHHFRFIKTSIKTIQKGTPVGPWEGSMRSWFIFLQWANGFMAFHGFRTAIWKNRKGLDPQKMHIMFCLANLQVLLMTSVTFHSQD